MRISDWSSDVCSSDLFVNEDKRNWFHSACHRRDSKSESDPARLPPARMIAADVGAPGAVGGIACPDACAVKIDRTSAVKGKSVTVRVDIGGCRLITKKNNPATISISTTNANT